MIFGGDPAAWLDLIDSQTPAILRLILGTWAAMPPLEPDALEDPTTERLCRALRRSRDSSALPFRIDTQLVELDPAAGQKQGRLDIAFSPMTPNEALYFCLECKRLNAILKGRRRALAREYVAEGMFRFVSRQYGDQVRQGAMLGYVLDNRINQAARAVQAAMGRHSDQLRIVGGPMLQRSSVLPEAEEVMETAHLRDAGAPPFVLHHIFVAAR